MIFFGKHWIALVVKLSGNGLLENVDESPEFRVKLTETGDILRDRVKQFCKKGFRLLAPIRHGPEFNKQSTLREFLNSSEKDLMEDDVLTLRVGYRKLPHMKIVACFLPTTITLPAIPLQIPTCIAKAVTGIA